MTKEELEKEAEKWVKGNTEIIDDEELGMECIKEPQAKEAYLAGAEFGYNKANEWHYVSKEGHPTKDDIYLTIRKDGLHLGDYCCGGDGDIDCQSWCDYPSEEEIQDDSVIAWKEIVLELKESE